MSHTITLLPGDGIGPEVAEATQLVMDATAVAINWEVHQAGLEAIESSGSPLPDAVLDSIKKNRIALKGPVTTPVGKGFKSVNVQLRQRLDLYANVRPNTTTQGVKTPFNNVDLVIFRENTEGLYSGMETFDERLQIADATARITRRGAERIIRFCFEYARRHDRKKVSLAHKANILKITSGLFLEVGRDIAREYTDIEFEDRIIDNMCMQLVMYPQDYDCIVTTNLFGDILSDLAAGLVGGLGLAAGANVGDEFAVFEAVHGSAPDIAGQQKANPSALIRSAELMLRYIGERRAADAVGAALAETYREGTHLTPDVGGTKTTMEFAERVATKVRMQLAA